MFCVRFLRLRRQDRVNEIVKTHLGFVNRASRERNGIPVRTRQTVPNVVYNSLCYAGGGLVGLRKTKPYRSFIRVSAASRQISPVIPGEIVRTVPL